MRWKLFALCAVVAAVSLTASCVSIRTNDPTPPELRTPPDNAYVGSIFKRDSLRLTFTWAPPDVGVYELYQLQLSYDPTFVTGLVEHSATTTSFTLPTALPVSSAAPVGTRYYWRVRACLAADECFAYSAARRVNVGRSNRDFNGDGYADVAIGAPQVATSPAQPGRVFVYHGAAAFNTMVDTTLVGYAPSSYFGVSVSPAGDLNDDGYADLIVGANGVDNEGTGRGHAYLYFGSASGLSSSPAAILTGDGGAFGRTVVGAGDVDGDGFDDVLVAAPETPDGGQVTLFRGGRDAFKKADLTYRSPSPGAGFGFAVSAGDANGDGYADVLIGAQNHNSGAATPSDRAGRAYLYLGAPTAQLSSVPAAMTQGVAGSALGAAVSLAGDLDQDGFADPVIGAPGGTSALVSLFRGGASPSLDSATNTLTGGASFGGALATDADIDGDGRPELLVGAEADGAAAVGGRVFAYTKLPSAGPPSVTVLSGPGPSAGFGHALGSAGDVDGDGFDDVVVGSYAYNNTGLASVYLGASLGLEINPDWTTAGGLAGDRYGAAVATR